MKKQCTTINIDTEDFFNPFLEYGDTLMGRLLYTNYFNRPCNQKYLAKIGENEIHTSDTISPYQYWTRSECLQSLACLNNYRKKLTKVKTDILHIQYGIIVNLVSNIDDSTQNLAERVFKKWPKTRENYSNLLQNILNTKPKLIPILSSQAKYPLYVYNMIDKSSELMSENFSIKRALRLLRRERVGRELTLPVYFHHAPIDNNSSPQLQKKWKKYYSWIQRFCPDAIICEYAE